VQPNKRIKLENNGLGILLSPNKKIKKHLTNQFKYDIIYIEKKREVSNMFKKKKKIVATSQDIFVKEYCEKLSIARGRLKDAVEAVIIRSGVVELYPEGADKNKAINDMNYAKSILLCAIGSYDSARNNYNEALESTEPRVTTACYGTAFKTSHELVEVFYEVFYKKA
jgi:hypothetical protein